LFERDDDLWIASLDDQTEMNLTNTPDRLERSGQWWPANPDLIVFNSADEDQGWEMSAGSVSIISQDGSAYQIIEESSSFWEPALSPDGTTIAYDTGDAAWLYQVDEGKQLLEPGEYGLEAPSDFKIGSPSWSPDGSSLAWWIGGSFAPQGEWKLALAVFDLRRRTVQLIHTYQPLGGSGGWLPPAQWSPDGEWLVLSPRGERRTSDLLAVHVSNGETISLGPGANPLWSPDGRRLILLRHDPQGGSFLESQVLLFEVNNWQPMILDLPRGSQPIQWIGR
jgi:Tol biopolymer transport system component